MSSPETAGTQIADDAQRILGEASRLVEAGRAADLPDEAVQQLLLAAVRLFAAKREAGVRLAAFPQGTVTATDVAVTCVAMTEAVNLELFELALWHGWSGI